MAEQQADNATGGAPQFTDADKSRARQWFRKAADCRERREYDYAVECFVTGLGYWPEAVEEGHMPLRALGVQRAQAGGKKPGLMDKMKKPISGKDLLKAMLNAEQFLALDPTNGDFAEALLKNAVKQGYLATAKFAGPLMFDALKRDKKPNKAKFRVLRDLLVEASQAANARGDFQTEVTVLTLAVESLEYALVRLPGDDELRNEQRDLATKLTIARGRYEGGGDFRDSLQDADEQRKLHDAERGARQAEESLESVIGAARSAWQADQGSSGKLKAYVDLLIKTERPKYEDEARDVLMKLYAKTGNYALKVQADDVLLRQLSRAAKELVARARQSGSDDDRQQARLAALEQRQTALDIFRERVEQYPTDLRLKFRLGSALFESSEYDEAIPMLQAALAEPRSRVRSQLMIGRAFLEKGSHTEAIAVLREAHEKYELNDETSKELLYWLGRAEEAAGDAAAAKATYGRLLRQDYNFMDGDARRRADALK